MANNRDEKHLPILKKVQHKLSMQTKSRQQVFNKSLSHNSLQSLSLNSGKPNQNQTAGPLDIIPERVTSVVRKKKFAKLATKVYGMRPSQGQADRTQSIEKQNSHSMLMSESTKFESNLTSTDHKSLEGSPDSNLLLSKLSSMLYTPSPIRKERSAHKQKLKVKLPPTEVMNQRWEQVVASHVPYVDQSDAFELAGPSRQFAAEYAQLVYVNMLRNEKSIGNYFKLKSCQLGFPVKARETMVQLMEELHQARGYNEHTLHIAVSIADRYLAYLARRGEKAPLLSHLTVICLLMAAKLNEPLVPAFENMVNMINGWQRDHMTNKDLVILEERIIKALEFELNWTTPLHFLERFQRLFGLDQILIDKHSYLVDASAIYLCRFMMRDVKFLRFKPSHVAVAAFMLALNANLDTPLAKALDVELLEKENISVESFFQETTIRIRING